MHATCAHRHRNGLLLRPSLCSRPSFLLSSLPLRCLPLSPSASRSLVSPRCCVHSSRLRLYSSLRQVSSDFHESTTGHIRDQFTVENCWKSNRMAYRARVQDAECDRLDSALAPSWRMYVPNVAS